MRDIFTTRTIDIPAGGISLYIHIHIYIYILLHNHYLIITLHGFNLPLAKCLSMPISPVVILWLFAWYLYNILLVELMPEY